jgi:hypothetical protein
MSTNDTWASACATVLTSATAGETDKAACRHALEIAMRQEPQSWPLAFMMVGLAFAVALGIWAYNEHN